MIKITRIITITSVNLCTLPEVIGTRRGQEVVSSFRKKPIAGFAEVGELGFTMDSQADKDVHGGPSKAVYAYASERFPSWQRWLAGRNSKLPADHQVSVKFEPGVMGENLTLSGLLEGGVRIGDRYAVRSPGGDLRGVTFEVTKPREPCFKLHICVPGASAQMVVNGLCGWYFAVEGAGSVMAGDILERTLRIEGSPTISEAFRLKMKKGKGQVHGM